MRHAGHNRSAGGLPGTGITETSIKARGCDYCQGYLFGPAVPIVAFVKRFCTPGKPPACT
ncbi:MAG: hypothetical protein R6W97_09480 [Thiobacillus sp.]